MFKSLSDIGFNVRPDTGVPGFRVGLPEDPPGLPSTMMVQYAALALQTRRSTVLIRMP
jgi:hypothetical protein